MGKIIMILILLSSQRRGWQGALDGAVQEKRTQERKYERGKRKREAVKTRKYGNKKRRRKMLRENTRQIKGVKENTGK